MPKKNTVKKVPMRSCVGCQEKKEKKQLIRVIRTPDDRIELDPTGRSNGRGAYICPKKECLQKAMKRHALQRSLEREIPDDIYISLSAQVEMLEALPESPVPAGQAAADRSGTGTAPGVADGRAAPVISPETEVV